MKRIIVVAIGDELEKVFSIINRNACDLASVVTAPTCAVQDIARKFGYTNQVLYFVNLPEVIKETFFDYIVVSDIDKVIGTKSWLVEELEELGVDTSRIIDVSDFYSIEAISLYNHLRIYLESQERYEFFITGVSHAYAGTYLSCYKVKGLNLALTAQDLFYDYQLARFVLESKRGAAFKDAIIGIAPFSLHYDLSKSNNSKRTHIYMPIVKNAHNCSISKEVLNDIFNDCYFSAFESFSHDLLNDSRNGCVVANRGISLNEYMRIRRGLRFWDDKNYQDTVTENLDIIKNYVSMCINKGVRPTLVTFPVSSWYVEYFSKRKFDEMRFMISDMADDFGINYMDYSADARFTDNDFYDVEHLNREGAKKISTIINEEVLCQ